MAKKNEIIKAILGTIAVTGVVAIAIALPGVLPAVAGVMELHKKFNEPQIRRSFRRLEHAKLISITEEKGKTVIRLTKLGKEKALQYKIEDMKLKIQKHWDKKWRLVIFDVPKDFHINRTVFARKLREIGFIQLQKSVWITPYPCEDEVDFLKEIYLIRPYVRVVTAQAIDIQADLIEKFKL